MLQRQQTISSHLQLRNEPWWLLEGRTLKAFTGINDTPKKEKAYSLVTLTT